MVNSSDTDMEIKKQDMLMFLETKEKENISVQIKQIIQNSQLPPMARIIENKQ